jgi:quercetin dioxygenase-like cupin family protein
MAPRTTGGTSSAGCAVRITMTCTRYKVRRGAGAVTSSVLAQISGPGEGHVVAVGPLEQIVFKATGSTTGDAFEFFEMTVQPGGGPPDHTHRDHDEAYYLCTGSLRFRLADQLFTATAGTYILAPRKTAHGFTNPGSEPATMLVLVRPAGLQGFFERLGPLLFGTPDEAEIARVSAEYACEDAAPLAVDESPRPTGSA